MEIFSFLLLTLSHKVKTAVGLCILLKIYKFLVSLKTVEKVFHGF